MQNAGLSQVFLTLKTKTLACDNDAMGLFTNDELESLHDLARSPGARQAISAKEEEQLEDVYWDNPDRLDQNEQDAIQGAIGGFKASKGPGVSKSFEDDIPDLFHKSRDPVDRGTDEALDAPIADSWEEYTSSPERFDWPGADTP
jgi:hypothetical protein